MNHMLYFEYIEPFFFFYKSVILRHIKHRIYVVFFLIDTVFWNETLHFSLFVSLFFYPTSVSLQLFLGVFGKVSTNSLRLQTFRFDCLRIMSLSTGCHFPCSCHC